MAAGMVDPSAALPPLAVLGATSLAHPDSIRGLLSEGMVVVITPDPATARAWLGDAIAHPPKRARDELVLRNGGLEIDRAAYRARWRDQPISLTKFEFKILSLLAEDFGRAWGFGALTTAVWGTASYGDFAALKSAVKRLRRKLAAAEVDFEIEAVRGVGYRLATLST